MNTCLDTTNNRYWSHVMQCTSCRAALKGMRALEITLQVAAVAVVGFLAAGKETAVMSGVQRASPPPAGSPTSSRRPSISRIMSMLTNDASIQEICDVLLLLGICHEPGLRRGFRLHRLAVSWPSWFRDAAINQQPKLETLWPCVCVIHAEARPGIQSFSLSKNKRSQATAKGIHEETASA
jgi:hypothetical protein